MTNCGLPKFAFSGMAIGEVSALDTPPGVPMAEYGRGVWASCHESLARPLGGFHPETKFSFSAPGSEVDSHCALYEANTGQRLGNDSGIDHNGQWPEPGCTGQESD